MDKTFFAIGQVVAQDGENNAVKVVFRSSGMMPPLSVKMAHYGYADPLRVNQSPLPQKGTHGAIIFPNGDYRQGYWLFSLYPNLQDAITSDASDPTIDYYAHWSGYWRMLSQDGTIAQQWPDGSFLVVGSGMTLPKVYRHIVNDQQQQQRVEYTMKDRVAQQPSPFGMLWQQAASGMTFALDASGHATITGGPSGSFTLAYGSGSTFVFDASGNMAINGKPGSTITMNFGSGSISIDASGNISLNVPAAGMINLTGGGAASDGVPLLSALINWLNQHTHSNGNQGSPTGVPITPAQQAQLESQIVKLEK